MATEAADDDGSNDGAVVWGLSKHQENELSFLKGHPRLHCLSVRQLHRRLAVKGQLQELHAGIDRDGGVVADVGQD